MSYPAELIVTIDFSNGAVFGTTLVLDNPIYGQIGYNVLGDAASDIVDISSITRRVSLKGGYNLLQDQFEANTGMIEIMDMNGDWNPENTASPYYGKLVPNRKIKVSASYGGTTYQLYSGYTTAYSYSYPKDQELAYLAIGVSDAFRLFNLSSVETVADATAGQTTGTRIGKILDQIGFPSSMRSIDTGNSTVLADPATTRTSLQALKNVEFSEQGAFYVGPDGNAIFKSRQNLIAAAGATPTFFSNDGTGIDYFKITTALDDKLIINSANIQRIGGTAQTASDADSIAKYFPHNITQQNLVVETDTDALNIAKIYVATRKETSVRIDNLTLNLCTPDYATGIVAALSLEYFNPMTIKNVQQGATVIEKTLQVVGVAHEITPTTWLTTFTTSEPIVEGFIIGNSSYGIIGESVLTY